MNRIFEYIYVMWKNMENELRQRQKKRTTITRIAQLFQVWAYTIYKESNDQSIIKYSKEWHWVQNLAEIKVEK